MKVSKLIAIASVTGVVAATSITTPVLAWHPKGKIVKYVQNQTQSSKLEDANTTAVSAKPGDTLRYVIEVRNDASWAKNEWNHMYYTVMTDKLPEGVKLKSNPAQREIKENIGLIEPGKKKTFEYIVEVTATTDGKVITNEACFEGDSEVRDNKQSGCDVAKVKVTVPPVVQEPPKQEPPVQQPPKEEPTPEVESETTEVPVMLPETGAGFMAPIVAGAAGIAGYAANLLRLKRKNNKN